MKDGEIVTSMSLGSILKPVEPPEELEDKVFE